MLVFPDFYLVKLKYLKPQILLQTVIYMNVVLCPSDRWLTALFLLEDTAMGKVLAHKRKWGIGGEHESLSLS